MPSFSKNQQDYCKLAQLFHSAYGNRDKIVAYMLQIENVNFKILNDKSIKGPDDYLIGATLLHIVCRNKHIEALDVLLKRGADITATNKNGITALHQVFHDTFSGSAFSFECHGNAKLEDALIQSLLKAHVDSNNPENPRSADGLSHFHIACAANHLEAVQLFLNSGISINEAVNINSKIFPGYSPLHFAVKFCGYETAKFLLNRGADVNAKSAEGLTPLHLVILRNCRLVQLKNRKGNDDLEKIKTDLLEKISRYVEEHEGITKLFLEDDRVLKVDEIGFSKFHAVCTLSDISFVKRFIEDVNINSAIHMNSPIFPGYTALHFAAQFNTESVKFLLANEANIEAEDAKGVTPFDICLEGHDLENLNDILSAIPAFNDILFSDNVTKLSNFLVAMRSPSTLEVFLQSTPKNLHLPENCPLWPGYCLSHLMVHFSESNPYSQRILGFCPQKIYLDHGGSDVIQDAHGRTPLHLAFYQRKERLVGIFFERQLGLADVIDNAGLSHLHIACFIRNKEAVKILLSTGAEVNRVYNGRTLTSKSIHDSYNSKRSIVRLVSGSTPLHVAVVNGNVEIVKLLLKSGADPNVIDSYGMTAMHRLTHLSLRLQINITEISNLLLSSPDLKNIVCTKNDGLSHLHFASLVGNADAVDRLLKLGADPNAVFLCKKNQELSDCSESCALGYTPMHFAIKNKDMKIIELLLQGGTDILRKRPNGMTLYYDMLSYHRDVKFCVANIDIAKYLTSVLVRDEALRQQVEDDIGLTLLHIACFLRDVDQIKSLLVDSRVDVNAQVHANSPIWPEATPLHILCESGIRNDQRTLKLLLDRWADVTIIDSTGETPVMICHRLTKASAVPDYNLLRLLLSYQTDFSVNPVNEEGISHFHLACMLGEHTIVEKFLRNGVDVNLPIDYLSKSMTFRTPLQFMLQSRQSRRIADADSLLKTMDVLLKYGADVNAEDEEGSTPFLEVARVAASRKLFFQKLVESGADINCKDTKDRSALEILFGTRTVVTFEELQIFLDNRVPFNTFNSNTRIGMISKIIEKVPTIQTRRPILEAIMEKPYLFAVDSTRRTPIHNLVANIASAITIAEYVNYINKFIKMGYDVDDQDSEGKTALHLAAFFTNGEAICALLISGADINITDMNSRAAFAMFYKFRDLCTELPLSIEGNRCSKVIIAMQICGLEVSSKNLTWANNDQLFENHVQLYQETISKELQDAKLVKIGTGSLTLRDFLSETGAVASGPSMMCDDREAVHKFFESIDCKRFPELSYLFKLQYRKMMKRLTLMDDATDSLRKILGSLNGFSMPEICCRMIIRFLTNTDVKNLIASV